MRHPAISDRMYYALAHRYERTEAEFASRFIGPEARILEVGAGAGFLACHCVRNLGVRHHAVVEANAQLLDLIETNLALNGVQSAPVIHAAVAPVDGEAQFTLSDDFWASSTAHGRGRQVSVPALSLPSLVGRLDFRPDTLIMDIEGGEVDLPVEHLALFDQILMETHPGIVGDQPVAAMMARLAGAGFVLREERQHVAFLSRDRAA